MGAVYFYHLTRAPVEQTLALLLDKAAGQGWRVLVRGREAARMDWLDQKLWQGGDESFLAHGLAGGPHDDLQPVLLSHDNALPGNTSCIMSVDGAPVLPEEVQNCERVCVMFDGHDEDALAQARSQWKSLTEAGCEAQYWSEESGRWEMKAKAGG